MNRRFALVLGIVAAVACDPTAFGAIAVSPRTVSAPDSTQESVYGPVARLVAARGLTPIQPSNRKAAGHEQCFQSSTRTAFVICGKTHQGEVQFRMLQWGRLRFGPVAQSIRQELLDSLRAEFGASHVRECQWELARDPQQDGCRPRAARDTA